MHLLLTVEKCLLDLRTVTFLTVTLPVKERIILKIATFVFHFFDGILPPYLSSCLSYKLLPGFSIPVHMKKNSALCKMAA